MTFRRSLLTFALVAVLSPHDVRANESGAEWSPLWLGTEKPTKGETQLPDGLTASMFEFPKEDDIASLGDDSENREPASTSKKLPKKVQKKKIASKPATKGGLPRVQLAKSSKPLPKTQSTSLASEAQARWPSSASEGFEFRVRNKAQISSMWVMKREGRYDVVYATNGGSRVNLTIPPDQFYALANAAGELRANNATEKCQDSFVQVHVVSSGAGRAIASCLDAKGKDADKLRMLGATLSSFVR